MHTSAETPLGEKLTVPAGAIIQEQNNAHVYVQHTPERFELRPVKIGAMMDGKVTVTKGLSTEERIVVRGAEQMPRK